MGQVAIIVGASGLIGSHLLDFLLQDEAYSSVVSLVRKSSGKTHPKLTEIIIDFNNLTAYTEAIKGDVVFLCVGTTKKKSPSEQVYRTVDYDINIGVARLAKSKGAKSVHLISAVGADLKSSIFYNRLKAEIERDLLEIGFESTTIYQPSLLIGNRSESRPLEKISQKIAPVFDALLFGKWKQFHSIKAEEVARSMCRNGKEIQKGNRILTYFEILK